MQSKLKILVALDLEVGTSRVIDAALTMAAPLDARLIFVNMAEGAMLPLVPAPGGASVVPNLEYNVALLQERMRVDVDNFKLHHPNARIPSIEFFYASGSAEEKVVRTAARFDVDYIVMGAHDMSGFTRLFVGSVTESVVRSAGCPVVVVREKSHNPEWRIPEIEPLCNDCREVRQAAQDDTLWCARHSEHHPRAHAFGYTYEGEFAPRASSSTTGT